eukprot:COSAG01_NODE_12124_length_1796_cov_10.864451_1_plen_71_part_00
MLANLGVCARGDGVEPAVGITAAAPRAARAAARAQQGQHRRYQECARRGISVTCDRDLINVQTIERKALA